MRITLSKFRVYIEEVTYDFPEFQLSLLHGASGSGKSSVFQGLIFCLYSGTNYKPQYPDKQDPESEIPEKNPLSKSKKGHDITFVEIELPEMGGLKIRRSKPPDVLEITLPRTKEKLVADAAREFIKNNFGSENMWIGSSYISQGDRCALITLSNQEKFDLLKELVFSEAIGKNPDYFTEKVNFEMSKIKSKISISTDAYNAESQIYNQMVIQNKSNFELWGDRPKTIEEYNLLQLEIKQLYSQINQIEVNLITVRENEIKYFMANQSLQKLKEEQIILKQKCDIPMFILLDQQKKLNQQYELYQQMENLIKRQLQFKVLDIHKNGNSVDLLSKLYQQKNIYAKYFENFPELKGASICKIKSFIEDYNNKIKNYFDEDLNYKNYLNILNESNNQYQLICNQAQEAHQKLSEQSFIKYQLDLQNYKDVIAENEFLKNKYQNDLQVFQQQYKLEYDQSVNLYQLEVNSRNIEFQKYQLEIEQLKIQHQSELNNLKEIVDKNNNSKLKYQQQLNIREEIKKYSNQYIVLQNSLNIEKEKEIKIDIEYSEINENIKKYLAELKIDNNDNDWKKLSNSVTLLGQQKQVILQEVFCPHCSNNITFKEGKLEKGFTSTEDRNNAQNIINICTQLYFSIEKIQNVISEIKNLKLKIIGIETQINNLINQVNNFNLEIQILPSGITVLTKLEEIELLEEIPVKNLIFKNFEIPEPKFMVKEYKVPFIEPIYKNVKTIGEYSAPKLELPIKKNINEVFPPKMNFEEITILKNKISCLDLLPEMELIEIEEHLVSLSNYSMYQELQSQIDTIQTEIGNIDLKIDFNDKIQKISEDILISQQIIMLNEQIEKIIIPEIPSVSSEKLLTDIEKLNIEINSLKELSNVAQQVITTEYHLNKLNSLKHEQLTLCQMETDLFLYKKIVSEVATEAMNDIIASINLTTNLILKDLFEENIKVLLCTHKETKSNKEVKLQINLQIIYKDVLYDKISSLSGGEQDRISFSLLLALAKMTSTPVIIIDESFASLDDNLKDKCIKSLRHHFPNKTVISVCHSITTGLFDNIIEVES